MRFSQFSKYALALVLSGGMAASVQAQGHEHEEGHPDIELENEGGEVHMHGYPIFHNHEHLQMVELTATSGGFDWHPFDSGEGVQFPGFEAEDDTFDDDAPFDLTITSPLFYWDGVGSGGFDEVSDGTILEVDGNDTGDAIAALEVTGSSSTQTYAGAFVADEEGGIHQHPFWTLIGDGADPANGLYLIGAQVGTAGLDTSETFGILWYKGSIDDETYEEAVDLAFEPLNIPLVPEPGTAALAMLGSGLIFWRRRRVA